MDGEPPASRRLLASGMKKVGLKTIYDLVLWGLKTGIIKDNPRPDVKEHAMLTPRNFQESYPEWLRYLAGLVSGYSANEIDTEMRINKDQQAFFHQKIAIEFHLHPSKARLIRFAFQVLNPVIGPPKRYADWRPWTKSRISLIHTPQRTGSMIDPEASVTKDAATTTLLGLLGVSIPKVTKRSEMGAFWKHSHDQLYHILEMARDRRNAEIKRLSPLANRHPETPDDAVRVKTATKQLSVVNAAWDRIRILFARRGYALPEDEHLLQKMKQGVFIPCRKK